MHKYLVFNPEDGRITQVNKVYQPDATPKMLRDRAVPHVFVEGAPYLPMPRPTRSWVDPDKPRVLKRPPMSAWAMRNRIKAGGFDVVVIRDLPRRFKLTSFRNGLTMPGSNQVPIDLDADCTLEWGTPEPGKYRLLFEAFPLQDWSLEVEAVE